MNHLILNTSAFPLGTADLSMETRGWLYSTIQFTATADVAEGAGAQFEVLCAPPSEEDPCVPGDFEPIPEVMICGTPAEPAENSIIVLQGPITAGQVCKAALPCPCPGFLQVIPAAEPNPDFPAGAEGSFSVVGLVQGPKK